MTPADLLGLLPFTAGGLFGLRVVILELRDNWPAIRRALSQP